MAKAYPGSRQATLMQYPWKRQFVHNPNSNIDGPSVFICEMNDSIVGHLGVIPVKLSVGGKLVSAAWTTDWYVLPEFRKKIIGLLLLKHVMQKYNVLLGINPNEVSYEILRLMNYIDLGELSKFQRLTNAPDLFRRRIKLPFLPHILGAFVPKLIYFLFDLPFQNNNVRVCHTPHFDERVNLLWKSIAPRIGALGLRDQKTLNWRFADSEPPKYKLLIAEDIHSNELLGYIILKPGDDEWFICDILVAFDRIDVFGALLTKSAQVVTTNSGRWLRADFIYPIYERWMKQCGFIKRNSWQRIFVWVRKSSQNTLGQALRRESWLATSFEGDADMDWSW